MTGSFLLGTSMVRHASRSVNRNGKIEGIKMRYVEVTEDEALLGMEADEVDPQESPYRREPEDNVVQEDYHD